MMIWLNETAKSSSGWFWYIFRKAGDCAFCFMLFWVGRMSATQDDFNWDMLYFLAFIFFVGSFLFDLMDRDIDKELEDP